MDTESDVLCLIIGLGCVLFGVASAFIRRDRYAYALPSDKPSGGTVAGVLVLGPSMVIFSFSGWKWLIAGMVLGGVLLVGSYVRGIARENKDHL